MAQVLLNLLTYIIMEHPHLTLSSVMENSVGLKRVTWSIPFLVGIFKNDGTLKKPKKLI